jgi:hypothetical protein
MVNVQLDSENTTTPFIPPPPPPPPPPPLIPLLAPLNTNNSQTTPPRTPPSSSKTAAPVSAKSSSSSIVDELTKNEAYNRNRNFANGSRVVSERSNGRSDHSSYVSAATIRNLDDKWIQIQKNTFTNWINEQLKHDYDAAPITDLKFDFLDGVKLVKLVDALQKPNSKVSRRYFKNPINQHQNLENITLALNAITEDGIKLVNIGNVDIANGNLKLILGLIWHLILRYQIGKTKIPPKKLILAWIKSVLPQCQITNITSDLNDGIVLG